MSVCKVFCMLYKTSESDVNISILCLIVAQNFVLSPGVVYCQHSPVRHNHLPIVSADSNPHSQNSHFKDSTTSSIFAVNYILIISWILLYSSMFLVLNSQIFFFDFICDEYCCSLTGENSQVLSRWLYLLFKFLFYSYVHTMFGSFLPSAPLCSLPYPTLPLATWQKLFCPYL
jgi:hypothetical protein